MMVHRDGKNHIIERLQSKDLLKVLASLEPLGPEDLSPDVDDTLLPVKAIEL